MNKDGQDVQELPFGGTGLLARRLHAATAYRRGRMRLKPSGRDHSRRPGLSRRALVAEQKLWLEQGKRATVEAAELNRLRLHIQRERPYGDVACCVAMAGPDANVRRRRKAGDGSVVKMESESRNEMCGVFPLVSPFPVLFGAPEQMARPNMALQSPASRYVDAAIEQLRRLQLMRWPGKIPDAMRDPSIPPTNDWVRWRPVPSTVADQDLDGLEKETGLKYPPLYRGFLQYQHFVELTELGIRFERHLIGAWRETLRKAYFGSWPRERIVDRGLLPFGSESLMDAGAVCFDTRKAAPQGDWPVVIWDHEWVGTDREVRPVFSSCTRMFECLLLIAENDINFIYHGEDDDDSLLPQKQQMLGRLLAIDPDGAGGPAREYWTSWGVEPVA